MYRVSILAILVSVFLRPAGAQRENDPFVVHETKPVITHGPLLLDPSETGITILWMTDTPCHSKVFYGVDKLDHIVEPEEDGLAPVRTRHRVHLSDLKPGGVYQYKLVSTRVVRLKPYWPEKGLSIESPVYKFSTLDRAKPAVTFSLITDTHEDVSRVRALMDRFDLKKADFLVHLGDAFDYLTDESQLFDKWLDPISTGLAHEKSMIYARGNHDLRGPFARDLSKYVYPPEGRFYFARDDGPVHLIAIDTGEDKPDSTNVYSQLNKLAPYRKKEFEWFANHVKHDERMRSAPFRIVVMHQPSWGWVGGEKSDWTELANQGRVDLVIAGHRHRFSRTEPGANGNRYPILVVGQNQIATVEADSQQLKVTVVSRDGAPVDSFVIMRAAP